MLQTASCHGESQPSGKPSNLRGDARFWASSVNQSPGSTPCSGAPSEVEAVVQELVVQEPRKAAFVAGPNRVTSWRMKLQRQPHATHLQELELAQRLIAQVAVQQRLHDAPVFKELLLHQAAQPMRHRLLVRQQRVCVCLLWAKVGTT